MAVYCVPGGQVADCVVQPVLDVLTAVAYVEGVEAALWYVPLGQSVQVRSRVVVAAAE
jgi:hypothetical protein